jgi:uncharacterized protein
MHIYLHGFASGPQSTKAQYLQARFAEIGIALVVPDLNQGDFAHLTISRQIAQTVALFPADGSPVTLIGSSLGGLIAAIIAQDYPQVQGMILLAPAIDFLNHWLPKIGDRQLALWAQNGYLPIYHYAEQKLLSLHYNFIIDAHRYHLFKSDRFLPTLIVHGIHDTIIPVSASRDFANQHPWVELLELDSDHHLTDVNHRIWQETYRIYQSTSSVT